MSPANQTRRRRPAQRNLYRALLQERVRMGQVLIDHLCHREAGDAVVIWRHVAALEYRLAEFRRWSGDRLIVDSLEDQRWHGMGDAAPPLVPACSLCRREAVGLATGDPLPPRQPTGGVPATRPADRDGERIVAPLPSGYRA